MHPYIPLLLILGCQLALIGTLGFIANRWYQKQSQKIDAGLRLNTIVLIGATFLLVVSLSYSVYSYFRQGKFQYSSPLPMLVLISILTSQRSALKARTRTHQERQGDGV